MTAPAGTDIPGGVTARLSLADGSPAEGYRLRFSAVGNHVIGSPTAVTDAQGEASTPVRLPAVAGESSIVAQLDTLTLSLRDTARLAGTGPLPPLGVVAGGAHTCAASQGPESTSMAPVVATYCWGDNSMGQLGLGSSIGQRSIPTRVPLPNTPYMYLYTGTNHS